MDRMIYLSMAGAKAAMNRQEVLSHNLANVNTTGFREEMAAMRAVPVRGDGASTRVYSLETTVGYKPDAGPVTQTNRNLDVAMKGNAWMAVQSLEGTEAYTRAGALEVNAEGLLVTVGGLQVNGDAGPINIPANASVTIAPDGTVSALAPGQPPQAVGRIKMVTPEQALTRGNDGLFRTRDNNDLDADPNARLQDGALEGSNVSPVETMVAMITAARQFEQQMKMITTSERQEQTASKLLSPNG
ncbi:flagellar basal-body rod protein FlgF [Ideonella sp. 4Y16]|uniref:Flagellar basal-body rod protein FlgF n=1 Tax=Ideonella alba TaxID=2824118 RepID=A0A941BAG2_9BURK|nr:flagellar basal-body rod protein FlgF [Ideonella alba]MBQ0929775.1 flagellar basal-body rod protein FlgF [Ideonella alba]MBQ0942015.1 flagellar basal-body rod protein FlgF [Ideonella alba]